jgi:hypothetical protein
MVTSCVYADSDYEAYHQARVLMMDGFGKNGKSVHSLANDFNNRTQRENENGVLFYMNLKKMCRAAYPDADANYQNKLVQRQLVHGLFHPALKEKITLDRIDQLDKIIELIKAYEKSSSDVKLRFKPLENSFNTLTDPAQNHSEASRRQVGSAIGV